MLSQALLLREASSGIQCRAVCMYAETSNCTCSRTYLLALLMLGLRGLLAFCRSFRAQSLWASVWVSCEPTRLDSVLHILSRQQHYVHINEQERTNASAGMYTCAHTSRHTLHGTMPCAATQLLTDFYTLVCTHAHKYQCAYTYICSHICVRKHAHCSALALDEVRRG